MANRLTCNCFRTTNSSTRKSKRIISCAPKWWTAVRGHIKRISSVWPSQYTHCCLAATWKWSRKWVRTQWKWPCLGIWTKSHGKWYSIRWSMYGHIRCQACKVCAIHCCGNWLHAKMNGRSKWQHLIEFWIREFFWGSFAELTLNVKEKRRR